jgi:hypothetical protein
VHLSFTSTETSTDGVVQREFTLGELTGALWMPASAEQEGRPVPLVLLGHGGGTHRTSPAMTGRARLLVTGAGIAAASLDAPGHGGRPVDTVQGEAMAALWRAREAGEPEGPVVVPFNAHIARHAVPEWRRALDALLALPGIGGPVGYFGLNMGTAIGIPLLEAEPRIAAAVLGQFWCEESLAAAARRITVPLEYVLQWDDEHIDRAEGLALFDAFGAAEKTLHANAGRHKELPRFEAASAVRFFARHLLGARH